MAQAARWISQTVAQLSEHAVLPSLVSHRGFHCTTDSTHRPIENSHEAYQWAWASGLHHAECDIAVTKDRELILCHDHDFKRLALNPDAASAAKPVGELTMGDLARLPLRSGSTAPRLADVLQTCRMIGGPARMVVEVKPANFEAVEILSELHKSDPALFEAVSVLMSFDLATARAAATLVNGCFGDSPARRPLVFYLRKCVPAVEGAPLSVKALDFSFVDELLGGGETGHPELDGLYIQYEPEMVEPGHAASETFAKLCARCTVGVWGASGANDTLQTAEKLTAAGATFVNTDLPDGFLGCTEG